jgi:hypothetical protein
MASSIGANTSYAHLTFDLSASGQLDMRQDDPVPGHIEVQSRKIGSGALLAGLREDRAHTGMRHIGFDGDGSAFHELARRIGNADIYLGRADAHRLRLNLLEN